MSAYYQARIENNNKDKLKIKKELFL